MQEIRREQIGISSATLLLGGFLVFCAVAAVLIGSFPLQLSIVTIFVFAGVHNLMEFRYFAARMPVRWGRSRNYYLFGIGGVLVLTAGYLTLYFSSGNWLWSSVNATVLIASWNTAFVLWVGGLFYLRGRQTRADWSMAIAAALFIAAFVWMVPAHWSLALVYLHPFIALWFLERQIRRTRPEWLRAYHASLCAIPVFLVMLWLAVGNQPNVSEETRLFWRIAQHSGSEIMPRISSHLLVSTHVFLETIHYAVWVVLIPLADRRAVPWQIGSIPLIANKDGKPKLVGGLLAAGVLAVIALWLGFSFDYTTTRDIYFAFAVGHVLAEFPFLVKML